MHKSIRMTVALMLAIVLTGLGTLAAAEEYSKGEEVAQWGILDKDPSFEEAWDATGSVNTGEDVVAKVGDPLEGWNRFWYRFNDGFYYYVLKPVAQGYAYVIPEKPRQWVDNFFENLLFPVRFVNCLLQGKLDSAGLEASKFIANTAFGLGGFGDVTSGLKNRYDIPEGDEDFGQTLGAWGMGNGFYLVWPFLGPSSARDTVGLVGDYFLTPATYINPWYLSLAVKAYEKLNFVSLRIGEYETLVEGAVDPYVAMKSAYLRYRAKRVSQ